MSTTVGQLGERSLLRRLRERIPKGPGVAVGIGDDAAVVETASQVVVTTDTLVEGIHFRRDWGPPALLGRKAVSVNLSDVAAMGGAGRYATVTLCLPADLAVSFVDELYDGLLQRAAETGVSVVGGNLSATPGPLTLEVTLIGHAPRPLLRSGAHPGDRVLVTGDLGAAAAALHFFETGLRLSAEGRLIAEGRWPQGVREAIERCLSAQLDPDPPLGFGRALGEVEPGLVHAAMDLSDGLSGDLLALCEASEVAAWLDASAIPVDPAAARLEKEGGDNGFSLALHGGEDYQLLLAVPPAQVPALREQAGAWEVRLTDVGEFTPGPPGVSVKFGEALRRLKPRSHDHFALPQRERRQDPTREA
jgi:thiamine-monophosphate kinase